MQFLKNTSIGKSNSGLRIFIKIAIAFLLFFVAVILVDRIEFPSPYKKIEKIIPNEDFKIVK